MARRILVVDDSPVALRALTDVLGGEDYEVSPVADGYRALELFAELGPAAVVTDVRMPGMDGLALLARLRESSDVPVVVLTADASVALCERALLGGAQRFLPFREALERLPAVVGELLAGAGAAPPGRAAPGGPVTVAEARRRRRTDLDAQVRALVAECGGNLQRVAERLGRHPTTVRYHARRLGLL